MNKQHQCPKCGRNRQQSFRYDTYYCSHCDMWLEPKCQDPKCIFCAERPAKPSNAIKQ